MGTSLLPITNWPKYNKSLINCGSLTFWVDAEAMNNWFHHGHHGCRGRSQLYTDQTISDAQGDFQSHSASNTGTNRLPVRVDERTAVRTGLKLGQQASTLGDVAYRLNRAESVW